MYAKFKDGNLEVFKDKILRYTTHVDGILYYVQVINPGEPDFNDAGYHKVVAEDGITAEKISSGYTYSLINNNIVGKALKINEEALIQ